MTKLVIILTEHGSSYSDEGLEYLTESIRKCYNDDSDLRFFAGRVLNNIDTFKKYLAEHKENSYLALSTEHDIPIYASQSYDAIIQFMSEHDPHENAWNVMCELDAKYDAWLAEKETEKNN